MRAHLVLFIFVMVDLSAYLSPRFGYQLAGAA